MAQKKKIGAEDQFFDFLSLGIKPFDEILKGILEGSLPWVKILSAVLVLNIAYLLKLDTYLFAVINLNGLEDQLRIKFNELYVTLISLLPLASWSIYRVSLWVRMKSKLETAFLESGIKSPSGRLPKFIDDLPIDEETRKLKLYKNKISISFFKKNEKSFAESLGFYIDEIRESRESEELDIIYSLKALPRLIEFERLALTAKNKIQIGQTRGAKKIFDFSKDPHLLVAGQSGNGKSTFLRQAITSLYLNNKDMQFTLVDLKDGLEFQTFENLKRVMVIENHSRALSEIKTLLDKDLKYRMKLIKANGAKDIDDFNKLSEKINPDGTDYSGKKLCRKMLIIDEAAQLYFVSKGTSSKAAQEARDYTNRLVAKGRAAGLHVIICTQRPDRFSVDPITKANLTAKLCFRLPNQSSSRVVLDSARASELPEIKGRAIFQSGSGFHEVQVPYLSIKSAEELLEEHKVKISGSLEQKSKVASDDEIEEMF